MPPEPATAGRPHVPVGIISVGVEPSQAAVREVREETGLTAVESLGVAEYDATLTVGQGALVGRLVSRL